MPGPWGRAPSWGAGGQCGNLAFATYPLAARGLRRALPLDRHGSSRHREEGEQEEGKQDAQGHPPGSRDKNAQDEPFGIGTVDRKIVAYLCVDLSDPVR
jgi:hypothetical protein